MIEIACSADARYLPHVTVMLRSLLCHTQKRPLRIRLLHDCALPEDGLAKLHRVIDEFDAELELLMVPASMLTGFPTSKFHRSCWYRVFLPELLPEIQRILYLDCDIIVTDDLSPLWQTDLQGNLFAAVTNPLFPTLRRVVRKELGIRDFKNYLNSGVLLLDLDALHKENLIEKLRDYARLHPDNMCPEQDALSVLMRGRWLDLHPRWNAQTPLFDMRPSQLPVAKADIEQAITNPAIIHFNGPFKPWQYLCKHPRRNLYFEHLRHTPWPEKPPRPAGWSHRLLWPFSTSMQYFVLFRILPKWRALNRRLRRKTASNKQGTTVK